MVRNWEEMLMKRNWQACMQDGFCWLNHLTWSLKKYQKMLQNLSNHFESIGFLLNYMEWVHKEKYSIEKGSIVSADDMAPHCLTDLMLMNIKLYIYGCCTTMVEYFGLVRNGYHSTDNNFKHIFSKENIWFWIQISISYSHWSYKQ